jgi:hypothetical protein
MVINIFFFRNNEKLKNGENNGKFENINGK